MSQQSTSIQFKPPLEVVKPVGIHFGAIHLQWMWINLECRVYIDRPFSLIVDNYTYVHVYA